MSAVETSASVPRRIEIIRSAIARDFKFTKSYLYINGDGRLARGSVVVSPNWPFFPYVEFKAFPPSRIWESDRLEMVIHIAAGYKSFTFRCHPAKVRSALLECAMCGHSQGNLFKYVRGLLRDDSPVAKVIDANQVETEAKEQAWAAEKRAKAVAELPRLRGELLRLTALVEAAEIAANEGENP